MNTDLRSAHAGGLGYRRAAAAALMALALPAAGQGSASAAGTSGPMLSSPVPGGGASGSGAGYHDPRSPYKPLQEKDWVVSWQLLSSVTTRPVKNRLVPVFPKAVQSLNQQMVRVQGFMLPLEPGDKQRHFLLSAVPTSCSFCVPAGPEGLLEVRSTVAVKYTLEPVQVEGRLAVLSDDPYGLYYRVTQASPVK